MQHTIYVTLKEFFDNGGELTELRGLYHVNTTTFNIHPVGWWGGEPIEDDKIVVTNQLVKGKFPTNIIYVQINVTPIYK